MNLHDIRFALTNVAIWLTVTGRNGRGIGNHLWPIAEGEPPEFDISGRQPYNQSYWLPRRFSWSPFAYNGLLRQGFVPPLCGRRSQSTSPRIGEGWGDQCADCLSRATQGGILPLTYTQAKRQSTIGEAIEREKAEWLAAGRPTEWPLSPSN